MTKLFFRIILLCMIFWRCGNKKIIRKVVADKNIRVIWYYESYISNIRDFIEVDSGRESDIIMNMNPMLATDVSIEDHNIIVKTFHLRDNIIYSRKDSIYGYIVKIDTTATQNDFNKKYQTEYYKKDKK